MANRLGCFRAVPIASYLCRVLKRELKLVYGIAPEEPNAKRIDSRAHPSELASNTKKPANRSLGPSLARVEAGRNHYTASGASGSATSTLADAPAGPMPRDKRLRKAQRRSLRIEAQMQKRRQRKGHSCETLRLQAQPLANGPVLEGIRP
jgi:hypothetical protein